MEDVTVPKLVAGTVRSEVHIPGGRRAVSLGDIGGEPRSPSGANPPWDRSHRQSLLHRLLREILAALQQGRMYVVRGFQVNRLRVGPVR